MLLLSSLSFFAVLHGGVQGRDVFPKHLTNPLLLPLINAGVPDMHREKDARIHAPGPDEYEIIFDAGSTGTRAYVFKGGMKANVIDVKKRKPGMSEDVNKGPENVAKPFIEMLDEINAMPQLKSSKARVIPVYIYATGGMRGLEDKVQHEMWVKLKKGLNRWLEKNPQFSLTKAKAISGFHEGRFAVRGVRHLMRHVTEKSIAENDFFHYAVFDLGGASMQFSMYLHPHFAKEADPEININTQTRLEMMSHEHEDVKRMIEEDLLVQSYLGAGMERFRERLWGAYSEEKPPNPDLDMDACLFLGWDRGDPDAIFDYAFYEDHIEDINRGKESNLDAHIEFLESEEGQKRTKKVSSPLLRLRDIENQQGAAQGPSRGMMCRKFIEDHLDIALSTDYNKPQEAAGGVMAAAEALQIEREEAGGLNFVAISGFFFVVDFVFHVFAEMVMHDKGREADLYFPPTEVEDIISFGRQYPYASVSKVAQVLDLVCDISWDALSKFLEVKPHKYTTAEKAPYRCFEASYVTELLQKFGLHPDSYIYFAETIAGQPVEWPIGAWVTHNLIENDDTEPSDLAFADKAARSAGLSNEGKGGTPDDFEYPDDAMGSFDMPGADVEDYNQEL